MTERLTYANPGELWLLSQPDLNDIPIDYSQVLNIVEHAYIALRKHGSENPVKTIVEGPQQRSLSYSMVGRDGASETVGFKVVYEFDPERTSDKYSFHSFIFLCDDRTGQPICLIDVVTLGPLRSSATSALMARAACPQAHSVLVVGTGVQAQISLPMMLAALPDLEQLSVYGTYQDGLRAVQDSVKRCNPNREVRIVDDLAAATASADIIIGAAGLTAQQHVQRQHMKPGAIAILLGYGIDADVLHQADYRIATAAEQMYSTCQDLATDDGIIPAVDAELPDILLGHSPARRHPDDIVFAYNSGMVVSDIALGKYIADLAYQHNKGTRVALW